MSVPTVVGSFASAIAARTIRVGIVGLGYAGLPLAVSFADEGFDVVGIDLSAERVDAVNQRRPYIDDVPEERYEVAGTLRATTDFGAVQEIDALTICVPTPLSKTRSPDISNIVAAAESIASHLRPDQLVVLQSTTYPGTTEEIVLPILERSGLRVGSDIFLGYAPERIDPGTKQWSLRATPKLVAGVTEECCRRTEALYGEVVDTIVPVSSTTVAETAKLHENTFRAVNIALANELALMCDKIGVDVWEVISAASTKPFGFLPHYPGPGLGGDCIPTVPHFLSWRLRQVGYSSRMIEAAHEVNAQMPLHAVQKVIDALNDDAKPVRGSRILLLGITYKPGVRDLRESPSLEVMRLLIERGGDVRFCDPLVDECTVAGQVHRAVPWSAEEAEAADCVMLLTAHPVFVEEPHWRGARRVVDTRNALPRGAAVRGI
jgi:UDP-N-acetyl-D-glucosamine dehydrogenase